MEEKRLKKSREAFINMPEEEASKEEWINWAHRIQPWIERMHNDYRSRRQELYTLKKQLLQVNKANQHYKKTIENFEDKIELYKSLWFVKLYRKIFNKV